jgi:hypothetical protein
MNQCNRMLKYNINYRIVVDIDWPKEMSDCGNNCLKYTKLPSFIMLVLYPVIKIVCSSIYIFQKGTEYFSCKFKCIWYLTFLKNVFVPTSNWNSGLDVFICVVSLILQHNSY